MEKLIDYLIMYKSKLQYLQILAYLSMNHVRLFLKLGKD